MKIESLNLFTAESVNNYIGLGFSGYKEGKPVWDVCKNVRVFDVEVCYERIEGEDGQS